jgi:hypothetical protein
MTCNDCEEQDGSWCNYYEATGVFRPHAHLCPGFKLKGGE